ncbi:hypothetical protein vseg_016113 [Gypsophila vaccaria]
MEPSDAELLCILREALWGMHLRDTRFQPCRVEPGHGEIKVNELPKFVGGTDPEEYLEWERKMESMFDFKDIEDDKRCKYAILKLGRGASLWFEGLKAKRARTGKDKITSWESLKQKLCKRYVPTSHKLTIYRKIAEFMQDKLTVSEYIDEFENLTLMGEVEENEEQKMSQYLQGLNRNVANVVEWYPYADYDTLCGLCLKIEAQGRLEHEGSHVDSSMFNPWSQPEFSSRFSASDSSSNVDTKVVQTAAQNMVPMVPSVTKKTSLSKVRCFKF